MSDKPPPSAGPPAPSPTEMRVRELVEAGDPTRAATEALRVLGPEVLGFLMGVTGNEADAEEVFALTSERLWRSLPSFRWGCSLRTWMYMIARREIDRYRRSGRRHLVGRASVSELDEVVAQVTTRSRSALRSERRSAVARLRDELPENDKIILVLRVDREMAWDDIALAFLDANTCTDAERRRESARLRQRFLLIRKRLAARARDEGLM